MKSLQHFFVFLFSGAALLAVPHAFAQEGRVDSFFDVNFDCDPCQVIADDIAAVEREITETEADMEFLDWMMSAMESELGLVDAELEKTQADLQELNDPQNWVESEGRRYDSADHAAMQRRSANLWESYQEGTITAQEYSDAIAKPFDDPGVARELERLKQQIRRDLEQKISDLEGRIADGEEQLREWDARGQELLDELALLEAELELLQQALAECERQCKEQDIALQPEQFGLTPPEPTFFDSFFDIFTRPFEPEPPTIPGLGDFLTGLTEDERGDTIDVLGGPIPVDLGLDIDFGFGPQGEDIPPPACHLCDPIWEQIREFEADKAHLKWQQMIDDLLVELLYDEKAAAQNAKDDLQQQLDELNNPPNYAESEGRRYDSNTHRAMEIRNARLWAQYKVGDLSAQELSNEWAKPFDDPDVQRELDDIIDGMKEEIEDGIEQLDETINELDEEIQEVTDELINIAGRLGALGVLLDHLYDELEECERQCQEVPPDFSGLFEGWEGMMEDLSTLLDDFAEAADEDDSDDAFQRLTFDDLVIPKGTTTIDMEDIIKKSNEYDAVTGIVTIEQKRYRIGPGGTLVPEDEWGDEDDLDIELELPTSSSSSSEESSSEIGMVDDDDDMDESVGRGGFFCNWFGWFCPAQDLTLGGFIACADDASSSPLCPSFETDDDDMEGFPGIVDWNPVLVGPDNLAFPLIINGMDGNEQLSVEDFAGLQRCLEDGFPHCNDLDFAPPQADILFGGPIPDVDGSDFDLHVQNGRDVLIGDPIGNDFIHIGGGGNDILRGGPDTLPEDLFGPGSDDIIGGPPALDILGEGFGSSEPNIQNDPRVRQVVQAAVQAYLRQNPLGPCEKLRVEVRRVRIGNRVRYTVRIQRVQDDSLCPPPVAQCPPQTHYQSLGTSCDACQNGNAGCTVIDTLPDGINCILCAPLIEETVDDDDYIEEQEDDDDTEPEPKQTCPDIAHALRTDCEARCSGECLVMPTHPGCYLCQPKDLPPVSTSSSSSSSSSSQKSVEEQCDSPTMKKADCQRSCDGTCDTAYTTISGLECYECEERDTGPSCPQGTTANKADCQSQCGSEGGVCVEEDGCYSCTIVNCPDGTYKNECPSSCSNGCDVVGQQHGVTCYQCKQSCEDVCAQNGYGGPNTDHSNAILSELNGYSCVSGANISIQTATIGSCSCIGDYSLTVNQTPPVCTGTPCGDVTCGNSTTCTEGDTTITVNCTWGGWEKIDKHQFRPKVGN